MKSSFYIWTGVWVAILPFIGVPNIWKVYLTCASGLFLALYASWPMILKKIQIKAPRSKKKVNIEVPKVDTEQENPEEKVQ